jgi:Tfp pilus assembly protein PilN
LAGRITWRIQSRHALGILLILFAFSLVGSLYLAQANAMAATNLQIEKYRLDIAALEQQNIRVQVEIATGQSLERMEQRARELGFEPATHAQYLPVPDYPVEPAVEPASQ